MSSDAIGILPLKVIVPITDWKSHYDKVPWMVKLRPDGENKLQKVSGADTFQVRSVSQQRFMKQLRTISHETMQNIKGALKLVLEID